MTSTVATTSPLIHSLRKRTIAFHQGPHVPLTLLQKLSTSLAGAQAFWATLFKSFNRVVSDQALCTLHTTLVFSPKPARPHTHTFPTDHIERARILHNTWKLHKQHSIIISLLAWGTGQKVLQGGEEQAANLFF